MFKVQGEDATDDLAQNLFNMRSPVRRSRLTLSQLTKTCSTKGRGHMALPDLLLICCREAMGLTRYFSTSKSWGRLNIAMSRLNRSSVSVLQHLKPTSNGCGEMLVRRRNILHKKLNDL